MGIPLGLGPVPVAVWTEDEGEIGLLTGLGMDWVSWELEREREGSISEWQGKTNWTLVTNTYVIVGFSIVYNNYSLPP